MEKPNRREWMALKQEAERNQRMTDLRDQNVRVEEIAEQFGITRQRVYFITNRERKKRQERQRRTLQTA